ncbi:hypothetical protein NUW54_g3188 [Trametes sanguinea]|uniref:Uncharacterized protein n=1 Tax=Trametes sanguinea TaxID=158606 RepID=A0ACC1Q342_9APHY|nr:hypothetical protein NUW54_g3188 [Trametes sanguinea]
MAIQEVNYDAIPGDPDDPVQDRSWMWQYCSEYGFYQRGDPNNPLSIETSFRSLELFQEECNAAFPQGLPPSPAVEKVNKYGGWNMTPSNVLFTNGEFDPWRTMGLASIESNSPMRSPSVAVPRCNVAPEFPSFFGLTHANMVHVSDLRVLLTPDANHTDFKTVGFYSPVSQEPFYSGLGLFEMALDEWLPCFGQDSHGSESDQEQVLDKALAVSGQHFHVLNTHTGEVIHSTTNLDSQALEKVTKTGPLRCAAVDSTFTHAITTGDDKKLKVWQVGDELKLLSERDLPKKPTEIGFTRDGQTIVVSDKFGDVFSYFLHPDPAPAPSTSQPGASKRGSLTAHENPSNGTLILGHASMLTTYLLTEDEQYIITADRDEHIRVSWFPKGYVVERYCLGHEKFVSALHTPSFKSSVLVSGGGDPMLKVWDWMSGKLLSEVAVFDAVEPYIKVKAPKWRKPWHVGDGDEDDNATEGNPKVRASVAPLWSNAMVHVLDTARWCRSRSEQAWLQRSDTQVISIAFRSCRRSGQAIPHTFLLLVSHLFVEIGVFQRSFAEFATIGRIRLLPKLTAAYWHRLICISQPQHRTTYNVCVKAGILDRGGGSALRQQLAKWVVWPLRTRNGDDVPSPTASLRKRHIPMRMS